MYVESEKKRRSKDALLVGDPGVKIDTKSLTAELHIWLTENVIFSYSGIARRNLLNYASSKQGEQLFLKNHLLLHI